MAEGKIDFGRKLIARGYLHDNSKFSGIEWMYLHMGQDVPPNELTMAIQNHQSNNEHHPEFWSGIEHMPEIAIAEMVCDWYARSSEFGTDFRNWIMTSAVQRYKIDTEGKQYASIMKYVDMLTPVMFAKRD
jgi:hypothetical protein